MKHDFSIQGVAFRLRPLTLDDAQFIVELRTDPDLGRYLHATSSKIEDQLAWTQKYFDRPGDWYFIVEKNDGMPEGAISIYNFDDERNDAEWGRWILRKGSLAAVESAALIYEVGFDTLKLKSMYTHTEEDNKPVVSFHSSLGSTEHGLVIGPEGERWIEHRMDSSLWSKKRSLLADKIAIAAKLATR